jgi:2',3'-cyclic-nucleotide 2'-phosphodiesterase (5'-nucleotidase family)
VRSPYDNLARQRSRADFVLAAHAQHHLDAWTPSASDLRQGGVALLEVAHGLGLPLLASNLAAEDGRALPVARHLVREVGGVRVGLLGLVGGQAPGLRVEEPAEAARRALAELRGRVDLVVCLSNLGIEADAELATEVEGIHFILGAGDDRMVLRPRRVGETYLLQPYKKGEYLGLLRLRLGEPPGRLADELEIDDLQRRLAEASPAEAADLQARLRESRGRSGFRAVLRPLPEDEPEDPQLRDEVTRQLAQEAGL